MNVVNLPEYKEVVSQLKNTLHTSYKLNIQGD